MCGIALIAGSGADEGLFQQMLRSQEPRGDVEEVVRDEGLLAGVRRLKNVDRERAVQPWQSADGRWLLCFNGEIFNYRQLRAELTGLGRQFRGLTSASQV